MKKLMAAAVLLSAVSFGVAAHADSQTCQGQNGKGVAFPTGSQGHAVQTCSYKTSGGKVRGVALAPVPVHVAEVDAEGNEVQAIDVAGLDPTTQGPWELASSATAGNKIVITVEPDGVDPVYGTIGLIAAADTPA
jgi:hypothetical protein